MYIYTCIYKYICVLQRVDECYSGSRLHFFGVFMRMLLASRWTWKIFHLASLRVRLLFSVCVLGRSFENTITWGGNMQSVYLLYLLMNIMPLKKISMTPYM